MTTVKIYKDSAWYELVGQKVKTAGGWHTLKTNDRIYHNNRWWKLDTGPLELSVAIPSGARKFTLPLSDYGDCNITVDWGDGSTSTITAYNSSARAHTYATPGTYLIAIRGEISHLGFWNTAEADKIQTIHFGDEVTMGSLNASFRGCTSLTAITGSARITGNDANNCFADCTSLKSVSGVFSSSSLRRVQACFSGCTSLENIPSSLFLGAPMIEDFSACFQGCTSLKAIPWDIFNYHRQVTKIWRCFYGCTALTGSSQWLWNNPSGASNYTLTDPEYDIGIPEGVSCYYGCTGLFDFALIPAYWKQP